MLKSLTRHSTGSTEHDLVQLSQSIEQMPSPFYKPSHPSARPPAPTPTSLRPPARPITPESPTIHRTYSARELPSHRTRGSDLAYMSGGDVSQTRSRALSTSLVPPTPPPPSRMTNSKASLSLYATPTFVTAGEVVHTPPLPDLPDPNTYPDPYPHYQSRAPSRFNGMTPPISLFSEGSSSASTRSSLAYNSVYLRSSEGGHDATSMPDEYVPRRGAIPSHYTVDTSFGSHEGDLSLGDLEPNDVGVATTSDEVVHLAHSTSVPSFVSGSRARVVQPVSESMRWSDTSYGRGMSMGDLRQGPHEWDVVEEEHESATDDDIDAFVDAELDDEDNDDDDDNDRTAAVLIAEEGLGLIVRGEGQSVDRLAVRPGLTV